MENIEKKLGMYVRNRIHQGLAHAQLSKVFWEINKRLKVNWKEVFRVELKLLEMSFLKSSIKFIGHIF